MMRTGNTVTADFASVLRPALAARAPALIAIALTYLRLQVSAQTGDDDWAVPENLPRGGAGPAPVVVAQPDGGSRIFWWDLSTSSPRPKDLLMTTIKILKREGQHRSGHTTISPFTGYT